MKGVQQMKNRTYSRRDGLIEEEIGAELLIFNPSTQSTHLLKSDSKRVFQCCHDLHACDMPAAKKQDLVNRLETLGLIVPESEFPRRQFLSAASHTAAACAILTIGLQTPSSAASSLAGPCFDPSARQRDICGVLGLSGNSASVCICPSTSTDGSCAGTPGIPTPSTLNCNANSAIFATDHVITGGGCP